MACMAWMAVFTTQAQTDHWEAVVQDGTTWHFLIPTAQPIQYWIENNFNDDAWPVGPSGFGYGDGDDATVVPTTSSIYLRHEFTMDNLAAIEEAVFAMDYDDGFVAYLNGTEIARGNCGNPGDFVAWNATLTGDQEAVLYSGGTPDYVILDPSSALVNGLNTLAIEVHNVGPGSSDLTARPFLFLGTSEVSQTFGTPPGWFSPGFSETHFVTFNLNMSNEDVSPEGVYLAGGPFGTPGAYPLTDPDGDDIWNVVLDLPHGFSGHYTFTNGACQDWSCKEFIGGQDCADPEHWNDRYLDNVTSSFTVSTCFSQCTTDGTCAAISGCTDPSAINHFDAATEDEIESQGSPGNGVHTHIFDFAKQGLAFRVIDPEGVLA